MEINLKKAWCVTACTDDYVYGCLRFAQRQKWLKSKYPTIVVLTDNISKDKIKLLEENDIEYQIINEVLNKENYSYENNTLSNLIGPLFVKNYDLLYVIDCDTLFKQQTDKCLSNITYDTLLTFSLQQSRPKYKIVPLLTQFYCKPNSYFGKELLGYYTNNKHKKSFQEESFLANFILDANDISYYTIIPKLEKNHFYHFSGILKPWDSFCKPLYNIYTNYTYKDFNRFIDNNSSKLELIEAWLEAINFFNVEEVFNSTADHLLTNKDFINKRLNILLDWTNLLNII